ncbi:MAG: ABC transporter ATP-binding protein [Tissierellales bacterium]|jgi:ABC-type multidrug transport system fused ATPase/permease subunit|nr:ABC transporter ATP-binding protein [Tissierellales bacterium]
MNQYVDKEKQYKSIDLSLMARLLKYAKPFWIQITISLILLLGVVALELYQPVLLGKAVDEFIVNEDIDGVVRVAFLYFGTALAMFVLTYIQAMILQYSGQKIIYNIRVELFDKLQSLSIEYFNNHPIGKLVTRVTNDTETLNELYTSVIVNSIKSIFVLVGIIVTMTAYNLRLSLITFTVIPFIILFTVIFRKKTREIYRQIRRRVAGVNAYISEHISGMKIVQIFAVEKDVFNRFNEENSKLKKSYMDQLKIFSIYRPSMYILNIGAFALLVAFGGRMVIEGTITIGTIVVFQRYISKFFEPIQELAEQFNILQSSMASSERIFNLLDEEEFIENKNVTRKLEEVKGKIEFRNVWFQYKEDEWVLKDVSFTVEPGQTAAFVGATGAGKTTIQNLISRYYDIQKGEILLDGINIKEFDLKELRKKIGQMQQDVFLFTGDIKSNIRLREENITEDDILKASKYVNADKFICKLENKYDQKVYERGATFSAGQRQLISFARTLAFDPDILILDEATANIDTETEVLIQDAMEKLMKGRTTLVVAHRLSTIQNADKIIVMHKGRIKEMGKHQELLANRGIYYNLYKIQYEKVI